MKKKHILAGSLALTMLVGAASFPAQATQGNGVSVWPHYSYIWAGGEYVLSAADPMTGKSIPKDELTWEISNPTWTMRNNEIIRSGPEGSSCDVTVSWRGYTDTAHLKSADTKDRVYFETKARTMELGTRNECLLRRADIKRLDVQKEGCTIKFSVDDPNVILLETTDDPASCFVTAVGYGDATLTATLEWEDGRSYEVWCDLYVYRYGKENNAQKPTAKPDVTIKPDVTVNPDVTIKPEHTPVAEPETPSIPQYGHLRKSGADDLSKLSKEEIRKVLADAPTSYTGEIFMETPSCSVPYAAGRLTDGALDTVTNRLNALRRIAGLKPVRWDRKISDDMQYGAVVLGALGELTHHPSQPKDMDSSFFKKGYEATSSSNLYAGQHLFQTPDGWMDDSDSSNIDRLGHRRWQLNPQMGKTGFGYVDNGTGWGKYCAEYSFDRSATSDYDFVGWPASGYFPNELFQKHVAWSISLNPERYQTPSKDALSVTLTREKDGKTWEFGSGSREGYFNVNERGYGSGCVIIFRPDGIDNYDGIYTVKVDGLKSKSGQRVEDFTYEVEFFGGKATPDLVQQPTQQQPQQPQKPQQQLQKPQQQPQQKQQQQPTGAQITFPDLPATHWAKASIERVVGLGIVQGYPDHSFRPKASVTSAEFNTMLAKGFYRAEVKNQTDPVWWRPFVQVSQQHGLLKGTRLAEQYEANGAYGSELDRAMTRYDMVQMMYNVLEDQNKYQIDQNAIFAAKSEIKDWDSVPERYRDALLICYSLGLIKGEDNGAFCGQNNMERAQACVVITRLIDYMSV